MDLKKLRTYHSHKDIIRNISGVIFDRPCGRMGENDWGSCGVKGSMHRGCGDMGEIDQHAQTVHFLYNIVAKRCQAIVANRLGARFHIGSVSPGRNIMVIMNRIEILF